MGRAKEIVVKVIPATVANPFVKRVHYSGKIVHNSQVHFGAFLDGKLHGVLSYGPSLQKSVLQGLVEGTKWNEFIELNRMAFDDYLPRNSESFCIAKSLRLLKQNAPHIKWVVSFADGTQCGDGTIYRASNFVLTGITKNSVMMLLPDGSKIASVTLSAHPFSPASLRAKALCGIPAGAKVFPSAYIRGGRNCLTDTCLDTFTSSTSAAAQSSPSRSCPSPSLTRWGPACTRGRTSRRQNAMQ